ncbi:hypothetical protein BD408DRAFT_468402, partial [Parasitella parasitica]
MLTHSRFYHPTNVTQLCNEILEKHRASPTHTLLTHCRPTICIDPILWLPMPQDERSRYLHRRLG